MNDLLPRSDMDAKYKKLSEIVKDTVISRYLSMDKDLTKTARSLGIGRATMYRMLDRWGYK